MTSSRTRRASTHPGAADITYLTTGEGWLYLATVIDIASRRVLGWATADHLRTELVADALDAACRTLRPSRRVIFHSDRGCQYTSREFERQAQDFGIRSRSAAPDSAGTTRLPSRSSPPSNGS